MGKDAISTAGGESVNPPTVTRGLDSHSGFGDVGIHWFRGSFPSRQYDAYLAYLLGLFGEADGQPWGFWRYDSSWHWENGVRLHYDSSPDRYAMHNARFAVEVPGHAIESMEPLKLLDFIKRSVTEFGIRPSRVDVFLDDFERLMAPAEIERTVRGLDADGRVTKKDWCGPRHFTPRIESDLFQVTSASLEFGTRGANGSGSFYRIYDKRLESKGENPAVRYERELSDEKAVAAVNSLLDAYEEGIDSVARTIGQIIVGGIDFRKRSEKPNEKNLCRLERYDWWQQIVNRVGGRLSLAGKVVKKTVERARKYIERQVIPNLQMLAAAFTRDIFGEWLDGQLDGPRRMRKAHEIAVREYQAALCEGMVVLPSG
jgi:DNA relaxase NicK